MPFDSKLIFRDGTVVVDDAEDAVPVIVLRSGVGVGDEHGAAAIDIRKTGALGLVAVLICPTAPTTTYAATLTCLVQESDHYDDDDSYTTVASFPVLYSFNRRIRVQATDVFAGDDIGETLTESVTGDDTGVIRWFDNNLKTVGGIGDIIVSMVASDDPFPSTGGTLTSGGGGIATQLVAGAATPYLSHGIYQVRFRTEKRYVRVDLLASAAGEWGYVEILLTNAGFGGM